MEYRIKKSEDYLEHHGIKGQRWGIRRYQNKDGSLTRAGQIHRDQREGRTPRESSAEKIIKKIKAKQDSNRVEKEKKKSAELAKKPKPISEMTMEELKAGKARNDAEADYKSAYARNHPTKESPAKKILNYIGPSLVKDVITPLAVYEGKQLISELLDLDVNEVYPKKQQDKPKLSKDQPKGVSSIIEQMVSTDTSKKKSK